jgi:hypothetical protein
MTLAITGYTAYGFKDNKYGLSGKWMVDRKIELFCQLEIGET